MSGLTTGICRVAPGENIVVTHMDGLPKVRTIVRFEGVCTVSRATVHNNNLPNLLRGLRERVFAVEGKEGLQLPPRPRTGLFAERLKQERLDLLRHLRGCQPITSEKFLEHYRGAKLRRYIKAVDDNLVGGVPRWASYLSTFVKAEFLDLDKKQDPAPRVIQPRHPRYNAALGRFIQPIERRVYRGLAKICGGPTVMKGYNADQVGQIVKTAWDEFLHPCAVGMDASRFDQHVSVEALQFEHSVYLAAYQGCEREEREELAKLLSWQVSNIGYARVPEAEIRYQVEGNRMSGDMNTALGNCILMVLMTVAWCRSKNVPFRLLDNGDDAVVIMDQRHLNQFSDGLVMWFSEMGFTMKVEEPVFEIEHIEFCQTHPVCVGETYRMVRNPLTALAKDTLWKSPDISSELAAKRWLTAVGDCGLSLCSGVPVMQEFYEWMRRHNCRGPTQGFGSGESGFERMASGISRARMPVSPHTRVSFWLAFGLTPDVQECLERRFNTMPLQGPCRPRIESDYLNLEPLPIDGNSR